MKLVVDLPDWCNERHIRVMAGFELAAYKLAGENIIHVKKERCIRCGDCCRNLSKRWIFGINDKGDCKYLTQVENRWECGKDSIPFSCISGQHQKGRYNNLHCSVEYIEVAI